MVNARNGAKRHILERLRAALRAGSGPVSGSGLAEELGMSRVAVWKHLEALREAGYDIVAERDGYLLASEGDFLYPWEFAGRESRIVRHALTDSTMDRALELALSDPECNAVVVAETQTAGRGRRRKRWDSPRGGLFATLVLSPSLAPWRAERAVIAGGIALCEALRSLTGEAFTVEWPNDVHLAGRKPSAGGRAGQGGSSRGAACRKATSRKAAGRKAAGRKAAGLLVEYLAEGEALRLLTLGLGVNVANEASAGAISLKELGGSVPPRRAVLEAFLDRFEALDLESPGLANCWNGLSSTEGRIVTSRSDGSRLGHALGLDDEGRLLVEAAGGAIRAYRSAEACIENKEHTA
jgi:BirA family biotin operon repressor/biotin-[acetyl-CoA-carboxylase] ligase